MLQKVVKGCTGLMRRAESKRELWKVAEGCEQLCFRLLIVCVRQL